VRLLGVKGTLIAGFVLVVGFVLMPAPLKEQILGVLTGGGAGAPSGPGASSVCQASPANGAACDFSRVVLASTEDVWTRAFTHGSSEQRKRWFRRGFESGDARQCDTFAVQDTRQL
jgi:predicted metalloprotease